MSCTEIYAFNKDGTPTLYGRTRNAWRGAMAVWNEMERRYLPPYIPEYVKYCNWFRNGMSVEEIEVILGYKPSRCTSICENDAMKEIWDLYNKENVPEKDKIVLATTFDKCLVHKEDLPKVIDAFRKFGAETSLNEQADILQRAFDDPDIIAVGWNQTSVNADTWCDYGYDEEKDESIPYNCLKMEDHWWLFHEEENTDV